MKRKPTVPVLFRVMYEDQSLLAVLPTLVADYGRVTFCDANLEWATGNWAKIVGPTGSGWAALLSRPAWPREYAKLLAELQKMHPDYELRVYTRMRYKWITERAA